MQVDPADGKLVEALFRAMQAGPAGEEAMMALFAEDAVFIEPFGGAPQTHTGKTAIRESFRSQWQGDAPTDLHLVLDRVDRDAERLRAEWTCTSSYFPTPMRGYDLFTVHSGLIRRLEIVVTEMPGQGEGVGQ